jgi:hypothetical protein
MFGNLQGWLISAVLAALILTPVAWLVRMSGLSAASGIGRDPANLAAVELPVDPDRVCPIFTDDEDAGPYYARTVAAWSDDAERASQAFVQDPTGPLPEALQNLVDARHCQRMALFSADLAAVVNYDSDHPKLEALLSAGRWICKAGISLNTHHQPDAARPCLEAAFALGRQLYRERIVFDECQKGLELMADSAAAMDADPGGAMSDFSKQMDDYTSQRLIPIWQVISSVDQSVIDQTAGDVAALAQNSHERMWRVEAALKLGRYRFNAGTLGDQLGAARVLRRLESDPDAAVATAARAGLELDIQTYRMIH